MSVHAPYKYGDENLGLLNAKLNVNIKNANSLKKLSSLCDEAYGAYLRGYIGLIKLI
jgi:hypothetical protein